jgi:hypothetical protein
MEDHKNEIISKLYYRNGINKIRCFDKKEMVWYDCPERKEALEKLAKQKQIEKKEKKETYEQKALKAGGWYGYLEISKTGEEEYKIRDITEEKKIKGTKSKNKDEQSKRHLSKGKKCNKNSFLKPESYRVMINMDIEPGYEKKKYREQYLSAQKGTEEYKQIRNKIIKEIASEIKNVKFLDKNNLLINIRSQGTDKRTFVETMKKNKVNVDKLTLEQLQILFYYGVYNKKMTQLELCGITRKWFADHNLLQIIHEDEKTTIKEEKPKGQRGRKKKEK